MYKSLSKCKFFISRGKISRNELLSGVRSFNILRNSQCFRKMSVLCQSSVASFPCKQLILSVFPDCQSNRFVVVSLSLSLFFFFLIMNFLCAYWPFYIFFGEVSIKIFYHLLNWIVLTSVEL